MKALRENECVKPSWMQESDEGERVCLGGGGVVCEVGLLQGPTRSQSRCCIIAGQANGEDFAGWGGLSGDLGIGQ